jgi:L-asparaginase II
MCRPPSKCWRKQTRPTRPCAAVATCPTTSRLRAKPLPLERRLTSATTTAAASTRALSPIACSTATAWTTTKRSTTPLQQAIRRDVARAVGMDASDLKAGVDGCSAPNYAMPLSKLATGYARLASGLQDSELGASFVQLRDAMTARPDLVSGTGRNDLAFMQAGGGDWVTKVGADGVQVVGSTRRGEAFALKIIDANKPALFAASVEVMEQLGWLNDSQREALKPWRAQPIINARGLLVGERRPAFTLQTP